MRRRLLFVVAVALILVGIFLIVRVAASTLNPVGFGALQVNSNLKAQTYLDGKKIGETPVCKCDQNDTIRAGEHQVKIEPTDKSYPPFITRVKIQGGVLTAVERTFLPGSFSSSYVLTLDKSDSSDAQIFIASIPDEALVSIDGNAIGVTPLFLDKISASEHEVEIKKQGFSKKTIRVRAVPFYKLVVNVMLGTESDNSNEESKPSPSPSTSLSPTTTKTNKVKITQTPTGSLNVRQEPNASSKKVSQVKPGEVYEYTEERSGWYNIFLQDGTNGWITGSYAEKIAP